MVVSIEMADEEKQLADAYAELNGTSLSEAIKRAYFEKIEDEYDIALADMVLRDTCIDFRMMAAHEHKLCFWYVFFVCLLNCVLGDDGTRLILIFESRGRTAFPPRPDVKRSKKYARCGGPLPIECAFK